jgi:sec-independent protein translocase protein TatB
MFGLGFGEIIIVLVLALILLGPQRLPEVAKQLGKGLREFKKATDDLKQQFEGELYSDETRSASRPTLVPPAPQAPPPGASSAPPATAQNVPGLEAATAEVAPPPQAEAKPPAPAPDPTKTA